MCEACGSAAPPAFAPEYTTASTPVPTPAATPALPLEMELEPGSRAERMHLALALLCNEAASDTAGGTAGESEACRLCVEALDTLAAILHNIALNPDQQRFRRLRLTNARFSRTVASRPGALAFLEGVGFERGSGSGSADSADSAEHMELKRSDPGLLWLGKDLLQYHRNSLGLGLERF